MSLECWRCRRLLDGIEKITFRTACPYCHTDLHVCVNCRHYAPGKPNDCTVPETECVRDREAANFCEDFSLKEKGKPPSEDPLEKAKRLFRD